MESVAADNYYSMTSCAFKAELDFGVAMMIAVDMRKSSPINEKYH